MIEDTIEPMELITELQSNAKLTDFREGGIVSRWYQRSRVRRLRSIGRNEETIQSDIEECIKEIWKKAGRKLDEDSLNAHDNIRVQCIGIQIQIIA